VLQHVADMCLPIGFCVPEEAAQQQPCRRSAMSLRPDNGFSRRPEEHEAHEEQSCTKSIIFVIFRRLRDKPFR